MNVVPELKSLTSKFIFIGGVTRSGKSFLCPLVSSFKKTEMFILNQISENITYSDKLKKINKEFSKFLLKLSFNEYVYNLNIGRNINLRRKDYTSVFKYKSPKIYLNRMSSFKEGNKIVSQIKKNDHYFPVMFHDVLINPKLLLDSFDKAKIIYIERHPVELIDEWINKGYSSHFWKNPRNATLTFKINGNYYPHWCLKVHKQLHASKNEIEKTTISLGALINQQKNNINHIKKKYKKKILTIKFDDLIAKTDHQVLRICKFLKTKPTKFTKEIIKKEKGNRIIDFKFRDYLKKKYLKYLTSKTKKIFYKLEKIYEQK